MEQLDPTLTALADPTRREIIDMLKREPKRAGDIAAALKMSAPATSRHLRVLRENGLIQDWHVEGGDSRVRMYRLVPYPFQELQQWLEQLAAMWTEQQDSFRAHAEKKRKRK